MLYSDFYNLKFKNYIFDCDSTLTTIEGMDELVTNPQLKEEIMRITDLGMCGEISFEESLSRRLNLIKPSIKQLEEIGYKYTKNLVPGAYELIQTIKLNGGNVFIVSGGLKVSLEILGRYLQIPMLNIYGVDLTFDDNGDYLAIDSNSLMSRNDGKCVITQKIADIGPTIFVGDGFTDLTASNYCNDFVGFGGVKERDVVKSACKNYYNDSNMHGLLNYFINIG